MDENKSEFYYKHTVWKKFSYVLNVIFLFWNSSLYRAMLYAWTLAKNSDKISGIFIYHH